MIKFSKWRNFYFLLKTFPLILDIFIPVLTLGFFWSDYTYRFVKFHAFRKKK